MALKKFELDSKPVLRNIKTREPCWPKSVCGSITHTGNFAAAAVGLKNVKTGNTLCSQSDQIVLETMDTGAACRTFNVLTCEDRRVAAALIAVG